MIDRVFIKEQVNNLIAGKGYDSRIKPMLTAFFAAMSERYNYTEAKLISDIEKYKSRVDRIGFYNIGIDNYIYNNNQELILDREMIENLNERNIEKFLRTIIKSNSVVVNGNEYRSSEDLIQLSSIANLYEYADGLYKNVTTLLANSFGLEVEEIPKLQTHIHDKMAEYDRSENPDEYNYYSDANIILSTIDSRIKDIQEGINVKEAYKAIYSLSLMNLRNRATMPNMSKEETVKSYIQMIETFVEYKVIFGIPKSELDEVLVDPRNNWKVKGNSILEELEESFKDIRKLDTYKEDEETKRVYFDRKQIIQEQEEENSKVDNSLTEEQIHEKVARLIEEKKYPREFELVIHEFFKRSVEEFKWDRETLEKKIENLGRNVDKFEYTTKKEQGDSDVLASFEPLQKRISINSDGLFLIGNSVLAATIMHELKHATDLTARESHITLEDGFKPEKINCASESKGLNELVTEASTVKIFGKNPYRDKYATTYMLGGYEELSPATTMIASAFGVSESEFLDLASKGEKKFKEIFETRYPGLNFSKKIDKIQDILSEMYDKDSEDSRNVREAIGYKKLFEILEKTYEQRKFIDMQTPGYDSTRARYDEYRLNKNMLVVQRNLGISRRTSKKLIPNYEAVREKSKIGKEEAERFAEIGKEISSQIVIRDNTELVRSAKDIRRYKRQFISIFGTKRKMLPEGRGEIVKVEETKVDSFEEKRKNFLQANKQKANSSKIQPRRPEEATVQETVKIGEEVDDPRQ